MRVAVFTMVYNESDNLPVWRAYYGRELGNENCFIIDHGSDDGSTANLPGFNVIKLARSAYDNQVRIEFLNRFVNSFLHFYDYVVYTDCDEILVPDRRKFTGLIDYCMKVRPEYVTSIGIDLLHRISDEQTLNRSIPILQQRSYGHYSSAMNKPNITSSEVLWSRGFHSREKPARFGDIFLFHLRYVDLQQTIRRLATTRAMQWAQSNEGSHQKVSDDDMTSWMRQWSRLPVVHGDPFCAVDGILAHYLSSFKESESLSSSSATYWVDTVVFGRELIKLPLEFHTAF